MHRRLNTCLLLIVVGCVLGLGLAVHLLHGANRRHSAGVLLHYAARAEGRGDFAKAIDYLDRYTSVVADDVDALGRLGVLLNKRPDPRSRKQAVTILERAVR